MYGMAGATNQMVAPEADAYPSRLSDDGWWWWDGADWVPAVTSDGLWWWDGIAWQPTLDLSQARPGDIAATLTLLAEDRFAQAAEILVAREAEWRPGGNLRSLVKAAAATAAQPDATEQRPAGGLAGLMRRHRADDEDWGSTLEADHRALLVQLGRAAPYPSLPEADALLEPARLLDARAASLTEAVRALEAAERAHTAAIEAAQRDVEAARSARERVFGPARRRLLRALVGEPGRVLAEAGPLRAHYHFTATPEGRLPMLGMVAMIGTAQGLHNQHRELIADVAMTETPEAAALTRCLLERSDDLFVVLAARSRTVIWRCPEGEERVARHLVRVVRHRAAEAAAEASEQNEDAVTPLVAGNQQVENELSVAYEQARIRLAQATLPPPELAAARQRVEAERIAIDTPPSPLT